jgi:hypothetical protein
MNNKCATHDTNNFFVPIVRSTFGTRRVIFVPHFMKYGPFLLGNSAFLRSTQMCHCVPSMAQEKIKNELTHFSCFFSNTMIKLKLFFMHHGCDVCGTTLQSITIIQLTYNEIAN